MKKNEFLVSFNGDWKKLWLTMKLCLLFLLISAASLMANNGYSQNTALSIHLKNATLKDFIAEVEKQSEFIFVFYDKAVDLDMPVDVQVDNQTIDKVLDKLFKSSGLSYRIFDRQIGLGKRNPVTGEIELPISVDKLMVADKKEITGTVKDSKGITLPGVSVVVKGTTTGIITDDKGHFKLLIPAGAKTLVFSFVGMKTLEVAIGKQSTINVTMEEQLIGLDEVVAIGYGSVRRKDLTGSVDQVRIEELNYAPTASFDEALAGRVAGVQVTSSDGQPGGVMDIVIRGANSLTQDNSPLYVIDGVAIENPDNAALNPEEIASINILKDASSTAIYGSRAANGVIMIDTKKGLKEKPVITFNSFYGVQEPMKTIQMMSPYEFVKYQIELKNSNKEIYTTAELDPSDEKYNPEGSKLEDYRLRPGINWQDLIMNASPTQSYNMAIRGKSLNTQYSFSGSIQDQEGIILNTGSKRYQGRVTIDQTINKFKIGMTANYSQNLRHGTQVSQPGGGNFTTYAMFRAWAYRPVSGDANLDLLEMDDDIGVINSSDVRLNPVVTSMNEYNKNYSTNLLSNLYVEYRILQNLKIKINGGIVSNKSKRELFYNTKTPQGSPRNIAYPNGINGSIAFGDGSSWSNENVLTYANSFKGGHNLTLIGGISFQESKSDNFGYSSKLLPNENLGIYGLDENIPFLSAASGGENSLMSYFSRIDYNFNSKYLLTLSYRADGSSKFHPKNRWGYFPSSAFAWNIKEENFMKKIPVISTSKFRSSYGLTGNNRVGDYPYFSRMDLSITDAYSFNNGTPIQSIIPSALGNYNLKWETTSQLDFGFDLGLFNNRIAFTADYYLKKTKDLLLNADMPGATGFSKTYKNIGSIQNSGVEFTVNTVNVRKKRFSWTSSFNISFNRNKVLELTRNQEFMLSTMRVGQDNAPLYIARIGYPAGMFYGFIFDGIYQIEDFDNPSEGQYILKKELPDNGLSRSTIKPGYIKYKDLNNDGTIDNYDRTIIGRGQPIHIGGFTNDFRYKNFDLNVFLQWSYGNDIFNANRMIFEGNYVSMPGVNQYAVYADRWTPENRSNKYYTPLGSGPVGYESTRTLEDGSYLRVKTVSLSYSVANRIVKHLNMSNLTLRVSAQNLFTLTNYSGLDPEVSVNNNVLTPGFDYSPYPQARTITFGINATF